jgi:2-dehydropantoate 2-reductase
VTRADAVGVGREDTVRVLILGTGAMAKLVGARLARTGRAEVTLAGTWVAAIEAMARDGITVEEECGEWTVPVWAVRLDAADRERDFRLGWADLEGAFDLVLVLVKSHQTASVAPVAARAVAPGGMVLTLQNGLGNREILTAAAASATAAAVDLAAQRVAAGVTSMGATGLAPARVRAGGPGSTVIGTTPATERATRDLAALWREGGMEIDITEDIERLLWRKLAVNAAINPLSALLGVPNGRLLEALDLRGTLVAAAREVGAVAAARGIDLGADPAELALDVARRTADNRSSMLQDVLRGAETEIDAISGAVVREGRRLGVPTPVNAAMWEAVRRIGEGDVSLARGRRLPVNRAKQPGFWFVGGFKRDLPAASPLPAPSVIGLGVRPKGDQSDVGAKLPGDSPSPSPNPFIPGCFARFTGNLGPGTPGTNVLSKGLPLSGGSSKG